MFNLKAKKKEGKQVNLNRVLMYAVMLLYVAAWTQSLCIPVLASGDTSVDFGAAAEIMGLFITIIGKVFQFLGVGLVAYSFFTGVKSLSNDDVDSKHRAISGIVIGAVMIGAPTLLSSLNLTEYMN